MAKMNLVAKGPTTDSNNKQDIEESTVTAQSAGAVLLMQCPSIGDLGSG